MGERADVRGAILVALLGVSLIGGAVTSTALAGEGGGWWSHRQWRHHHGDPERAVARTEFAVNWVLDQVDATPAQQDAVEAIIRQSVEELNVLMQQERSQREALIGALSGATIDRAALEAIRQAELDLADLASIQLIGALADAAEVLTPEQRAELVELSRHFGH